MIISKLTEEQANKDKLLQQQSDKIEESNNVGQQKDT